jgi:predicted RNA binding protein YcfA (HicA-like mRNA interferase family)
MPKLRDISGKKLIKIFNGLGFVTVGQNGSHIKMNRLCSGQMQILVVPNHFSIAKGTLKDIYTQALKYIPEKELKRLFYS